VKRRHQIDDPRRRAAHHLAQLVRPHAAFAHGERHQVRPRVREEIHRPQVGRGFERDRVAALEKERRDQTDRLLRAARDQDLPFGRRKAASFQAGRDRAPQLRKSRRQVPVIPREPRDSVLQREDFSRDRAGPRKVGAEKLDRPAGALDEAPVNRVPPERRRFVSRSDGAPRARANAGAAAAPALEPPLLPQNFVRRDDGRPAHRQESRKVAFRGNARARRHIAPQDGRAQTVRQTLIDGARRLGPGSERVDELVLGQLPAGRDGRTHPLCSHGSVHFLQSGY
jgi:hypothetical protein